MTHVPGQNTRSAGWQEDASVLHTCLGSPGPRRAHCSVARTIAGLASTHGTGSPPAPAPALAFSQGVQLVNGIADVGTRIW